MTNPNDPIVASEHDIPSGQGGTIPSHWKHIGLTKREYFAAMAMMGAETNMVWPVKADALAAHAVICSDALIAELNKEIKRTNQPDDCVGFTEIEL